MGKYVDLHVHSDGSLRDAVASVEEIFEVTKESGRHAVAITDHGNMSRIFEALKYASKMQKKAFADALSVAGASDKEVTSADKAFGAFGNIADPDTPQAIKALCEKYPKAKGAALSQSVKFIPGVEMYTKDEDNEEARYHIVLLAKDWTGVKTLFKVCNLAQLDRTGQKKDMPRVSLDSLAEFIGEGTEGHGHVVATSACMQGHLSSCLLRQFYLQKKIGDRQNKLDALPHVYPADTLERLGDTVQQKEKSVEETHDIYMRTKALASKKLETKIQRLRAKAEKLESQSKDASVEYETLDALMAEQTVVSQAITDLPETKADWEQAKEVLKATKETFRQTERSMRKQLRLSDEIRELENTLERTSDGLEEATVLAKKYDSIFGHGNYFIELQNHGIVAEDVIRPKLKQIATETGIPLTVANDVHYARKEDQRKRNIISSIRFLTPIQDAENQPGNSELYFKSDEEMYELFPDDTEALQNTVKIADMCNVFYHKEMHLPVFQDPKHRTPQQYLRDICYEGFSLRYPDWKTWPKAKRELFSARVNSELEVIHKMGFDSYIPIVRDFIFHAKEKYGREKIGPGRGSAAGSIVCYLVQITDVDPMKYGLLFERFLNPERVTMPDIDTDLAPSIRDDTIAYVANKYQYMEEYKPELKNSVAYIATEGTLAARAAIKNVAKVLFIAPAIRSAEEQSKRASDDEDDEALEKAADAKVSGLRRYFDNLAKMVPAKPGMTIKAALTCSPELKAQYDNDSRAKEAIENAMLVEGLPANSGVHASGIIIADKPLSEYAAMYYSDKVNGWVVQYDMVSCEADLGLLKIDFLGLKNLDIISDAMAAIKKNFGVTVDLEKLQKADDKDVFKKIYASGQTNGVFQFESGGMKKILRKFKPDSIADVILMNAAYRPGPMQYIPEITAIKNGEKEASYIVPEMKKILSPTYGSAIYQEQIMAIFQLFGYTLGQSDMIRRAMSKKHFSEIAREKDKFTSGMREKGASAKDIQRFWEQLLDFASYAFNKSHATAYSIVSYYTAWLKLYYPAEYIAALLSYSDNDSFAMYINDARLAGVQTVKPDINRSQSCFTAIKEDRPKILFGLSPVKGVASNAEDIVTERNQNGMYTSFENFVARAAASAIKPATVTALIKCGAFDTLCDNRNRMIKAFDGMYSAAKKQLALDKSLQETEKSCKEMFDAYAAIPDFTQSEKLEMEKEAVGVYLTGNPLDGVTIPSDAVSVSDIEEDGMVLCAGCIDGLKILHRKKDGASFCKFTLGDYTGDIEVLCFCTEYQQNQALLKDGAVIKMTGKIKVEFDEDGEIESKTLQLKTAEKI